MNLVGACAFGSTISAAVTRTPFSRLFVAPFPERRTRGAAAAIAIAAAIAAPALVTLLALTSVSPAIPRMVYIGAIAAAAALGGTVSGLGAAVLSFLAFAYFFEAPTHELTIQHSSEGVSLIVFLVVGVAIGELVARERRERRRAQRAAADTLRLEAVAGALAQARTPQQVLDAILTEGLAAAEARAGVIGLLADDGDTIEAIAYRGYPDDRFGPWARFSVRDHFPLSDAVRTGEPVFLSSSAERLRRYPLLEVPPEKSHALACLPLVFEGRTLGGVALGFPNDQEFDAARRALKEALAAQAAAALDRTRLDQAERALRERLTFLVEASALLASSLDYQRTLSRLTELCVPRLADWCAVDMLAPDGTIERLAVAHKDPEKVRYAHELAERFPPDPDAPTGVPRVLRTGEVEFLREIPDELLVEAAKGDEELLRVARELRLRSAIVVPLTARGRTLGALSLVAAESERRYTDADVELAQDLGRRAAVAVDNARLHAEAEQRAEAARALHHVADAVVLVDPLGIPRYWNEAATRLLGDESGLRQWDAVASLLSRHEWSDDVASVTLPIELHARERWLQVSRVEFDEGRVYALRDVTEERLMERTRSEFVATASHELRTPIAAVYGTFQTLLRDDVELDRDVQEQFLRLGLQESDRLRRIVEDLLLAGQLEAGAPAVEAGTCDVHALVAELVESTSTRLNGAHRLETAVAPGVAVAADPLRLRQVLSNLIENAIKYSPAGGSVVVSARRVDGSVCIEVADEGIGIAEADQARIFERFVRLDPALTRGTGGTGLGLYICRELVDRMGGRITVRSRERHGSTFTVELPAARENV